MEGIRKQIYYASMLHDIGKVVLRSGLSEKKQNHSQAGSMQLKKIMDSWCDSKEVIEAIRYHHIRELENSDIDNNHIAWIVCEADNIAAGMDRRDRPAEGDDVDYSGVRFSQTKCLDNIFNIVRTERLDKDTKSEYPLIYGMHEETTYTPPDFSGDLKAYSSNYVEIWNSLKNNLTGIDWYDNGYMNSLYNLLEGYFSYIPSSTDTNQVTDISLFDHCTLTSAVSSCIIDYCEEKNISDYKKLCFNDVKKFRSEKLFLLVHADLSGIQDFIYTISSKNALKSLRGRSFYLELILEQIANEILFKLDLSRSNLIYSGGGGFYMLVPNTKKSRDTLDSSLNIFNQWLLDNFGIDLYLGIAWSEASPAHFMFDKNCQSVHMSDVFREVSQQLSAQKLHRYSSKQLANIFKPVIPEHGDRECSICGKSEQMISTSVEKADFNFVNNNVCIFCSGLIDLGSTIVNKNKNSRMAFVVEKERPQNGTILPLPGYEKTFWLNISTPDQVRKKQKNNPENIVRIYSKNYRGSGLEASNNLWVGDYNFCINKPEGSVEFKDFIDFRDNLGIKRIAVMRADVDNLGDVFAKGFRGDSSDKSKYETLGRYATLSRSLSRFFKNSINHIAAARKRSMVLVYAGGDDIFAVGAWDEIIEFALDLRSAFRDFTADKLSFSAGIGFFRHNYPIFRMADLTGQLEAAAKTGKKDQIALFGMQNIEGTELCDHIHSWKNFSEGVLPKRDFLMKSIKHDLTSSDKQDYSTSKSFLYKLFDLIISAEEGKKISLARLAYLLARREPPLNSPPADQQDYIDLRNNIYNWTTDKFSRKELKTAIMLCVYAIRGEGE